MQRRLLGSSTPRHGCDRGAVDDRGGWAAATPCRTRRRGRTCAGRATKVARSFFTIPAARCSAARRQGRRSASGPAAGREVEPLLHDGGDASRGVVVDELRGASATSRSRSGSTCQLGGARSATSCVDVLEPLFTTRSGAAAAPWTPRGRASASRSTSAPVAPPAAHGRPRDTPSAAGCSPPPDPRRTPSTACRAACRAAVELDITDARQPAPPRPARPTARPRLPDASEVAASRRFRQFLRDGLRHDGRAHPKRSWRSSVASAAERRRAEGRDGASGDGGGAALRAVALEDIGFSDGSSSSGLRALVAQYGSALHNCSFLPDAAVVLMLPMPGRATKSCLQAPSAPAAPRS